MNMQNINFYKFKKKIGVVELFINNSFKTIKDKLGDFIIEDNSIARDNWQVPYMEQYFNADRSIKICNTYDEPESNISNFYLVFFIYELTEGQILRTPFGNIIVTKLKKIVREYKKILDFNPID